MQFVHIFLNTWVTRLGILVFEYIVPYLRYLLAYMFKYKQYKLHMPQVVLVNPLIPPNTGNIARTCAARSTELHLVGPLGFELSNRYLKRAGLDYWPHVKLHYHESLDIFQDVYHKRGGRCLGFSVRGNYSYTKFAYKESDWLVFGSETDGLPKSFLEKCDYTLTIPMKDPQIRSLNLSVSVAVALFESCRQLGYL
ncbi:probable rRNA methylase [Richelia intracellularis HM01]|nr:probable rRNA methylase [Richelia intracellularis HM01]